MKLAHHFQWAKSNHPEQETSEARSASKGMVWYVYILKCSKESYYVGITQDLGRRFQQHVQGLGARFTKWKKPEAVLHFELFDTKFLAMEREKQLKRWSRSKKQALIDGDATALRRLSTSHDI
jgi:predicted GIY-YIG superfamily endonuclease